MKRFFLIFLFSVGALMALAPSEAFAAAYTDCGLKSGYITGITHGDWSNEGGDDVAILVIEIRDIDGHKKIAYTQGVMDLQNSDRARSLQSMAVSAMLSKSRVKLMFKTCNYNGWAYTNLFGMEMRGD